MPYDLLNAFCSVVQASNVMRIHGHMVAALCCFSFNYTWSKRAENTIRQVRQVISNYESVELQVSITAKAIISIGVVDEFKLRKHILWKSQIYVVNYQKRKY